MADLNANQNSENDVVCTEFWCKDLKPYTDSLLFDSGELIAKAKFSYKGNDSFYVNLMICGDVSVYYKDEHYKYPSDFPDELRELIKNKPDEYYDKVEIRYNNWFEYLWDGDGEVEECDLCKMEPSDVLKTMFYFARQYFKIDNAA